MAAREAQAERAKLRQHVSRQDETISELRRRDHAHQDAKKRLAQSIATTQQECTQLVNRAACALEIVLREKAVADSIKAHQLLATNSHRLGRVVIQRTSTKSVEMWEDGHAFRDIKFTAQRLEQTRVVLEKAKRDLANRRRVMRRQAVVNSSDGADASSTDAEDGDGTIASGGARGSLSSGYNSLGFSGGSSGMSWEQQQQAFDELSIAAEEEANKMAFDDLKAEEARVKIDEVRLINEKTLHIRETKRVRDEDASRFNTRPVLNKRYLLVQLLGRGGFSEVWEAYDLKMFVKCAVKIHQLNPHWNEAKKQNYTKHATREYEIHKALSHPNIVRLVDVFEIDQDSFATVLELCEGDDLDMRLKRRTQLSEREARSIIVQMLRGLLYLNIGETGSSSGAASAKSTAHAAKATPKVIHYDLKPGNILFDKTGQVKITDFGLSKIFEESTGKSTMELTSQGAGTYWYLPPECFVVGDSAPQISSKVDVWAVGVMFYQMLYGKRPFGEGLSQERILTSQAILNATEVIFPENTREIKVSSEAKEFIKKCLHHSQLFRPTIPDLCTEAYIMNSRKSTKRN